MKEVQELTPKEILRPLSQLNEKLMSDDGRQWLEAFNRFLRKQECWVISSKWKIWKTALIGTERPIAEMFELAKANGYHIDKSFEGKGSNFEPLLAYPNAEEEVYFACVTPKELKFKNSFTLRQVYERAAEEGLDMCFSGDALYVAAFDKEKIKEGDSVVFAHKPQTHSWGDSEAKLGPGIFNLCNFKSANGLTLSSNNGNMDEEFEHPNCLTWKIAFRIRVRKIIQTK